MDKQESYFDGKLIQYIGWCLLGGLVSALTLGICYPFAVCFVESWKTKHTVIEGKRLTFDGHGGQLIGKWICWMLLCIVTLGIYSLWIPIKLEAWKVKHTLFAE